MLFLRPSSPQLLRRGSLGRGPQTASCAALYPGPSPWGPSLGCASSDLPNLTQDDTPPQTSWLVFHSSSLTRSVWIELLSYSMRVLGTEVSDTDVASGAHGAQGGCLKRESGERIPGGEAEYKETEAGRSLLV